VKNRIGVEYYDTYKFGRLTHDKWIQLVLIEVDRDGKRDLLEWIKNHCSKHCVWLKTEADIEHYALRCLVSHAYEAWSDYKYAGLPFDIWNLMNPWYAFDTADGKVEKGESKNEVMRT